MTTRRDFSSLVVEYRIYRASKVSGAVGIKEFCYE